MTQLSPPVSVTGFLRETNSTTRILLFGAFLNQLGYFIQAYLIVYMSASGFSVDQAGLGLGLFCAASIIGTIVGSSLCDRFGSRNTIAIASGFLALSVVFVPSIVRADMPTVGWMGWLFLCGFFAQMSRPASGVILSAHVPDRYRVMGFSMFRIALNVGGAAGPLLATVLIPYGWHYVFALNAVCSIGYCLIALLMLPNESAAKATQATTPEIHKVSWGALLTDGKFVAFLLSMLLSSVVFIQFTSTVPVAIESKGLPLASYSSLLTIYAIVLILLELKISAIVSRFQDWIPATVGTTLLCLGVASFGLSLGSDLLMKISATVLVVGLMISGPTMFAYPASFPMEMRSRYIGATQAAFSTGNALGPVIGLYLFNSYGSVVWIVCLVLAILSGLLVMVGMKPNAKSKENNDVKFAS
ncbi:MFS transporter [Chitinimonas lacunae]|uniref:MFS transporter n=1 Tax=Chitinimonas lacunae TaxID=1963018 RepID=A0ABV8MUS3_9NEIS